jgi:hypothetical protein
METIRSMSQEHSNESGQVRGITIVLRRQLLELEVCVRAWLSLSEKTNLIRVQDVSLLAAGTSWVDWLNAWGREMVL